MNKDQSLRWFKIRNYVQAALIALCLWIPSYILTQIILSKIQAIGEYISFPASALGQVSIPVLAIAGVLVSLLFVVFTAINGQGRENRYSGFQIFRRATEDLENLNVRLKKQALKLTQGVAMGDYNVKVGQQLAAIQVWVADLDCLLQRLNSITMNWRGWNSDIALEEELLLYITSAYLISKNIGDDANEALMVFEQSMHSILVGLRRLDEAVIADLLLLRLGTIVGSLITLIGFGLVCLLASNLDIGLSYSSDTILFYAIFISINVFLHLVAVSVFIFRWWDQIRERDIKWPPNLLASRHL